ncbi:MAG: hypothetical protein HRT57_01730 [Crocinitomicaceae bacterium]|nr:hypothetical protein [Crocinitomicaceae bacterium]
MKYLFLIAIALVLSSCIKDKLENQSAILVGTWTWDHSIEYTYDEINLIEVESIIPASDFIGTYAVELKKQGKIAALRDNVGMEQFRILLPIFKSGTCDLTGGYEYKINLNNNENDTIVGCVNSDTLTMSDFHLPLKKGSADYPYYKHVYLK